MFETIRTFLSGLGQPRHQTEAAPDETALSALALALSVIRADGSVSDSELAALEAEISRHYGLDHAHYESLRSAALRAEADATDHYRFAAHLRRHLDEPAREEFIAMLWTLVRADGNDNEIEGHLVYRIAEMIEVSGRDRRRPMPADGGDGTTPHE